MTDNKVRKSAKTEWIQKEYKQNRMHNETGRKSLADRRTVRLFCSKLHPVKENGMMVKSYG